MSKLKINLPAYYKECFDAWSEFNGKTPTCYKEIINRLSGITNFLIMNYDFVFTGSLKFTSDKNIDTCVFA